MIDDEERRDRAADDRLEHLRDNTPADRPPCRYCGEDEGDPCSECIGTVARVGLVLMSMDDGNRAETADRIMRIFFRTTAKEPDANG